MSTRRAPVCVRGRPVEGRAALAGLLLVALPSTAAAGVFGVPRNLAADGQTCTGAGTPVASCPAASVDPPGWIILTGTAAAPSAGDTVHQLRLFIEVTGTTLDVKVFDPGDSGSRDQPLGGASETSFELFRPDGVSMGASYRVLSFGADNATTANRLARLSFGGAFTAANAGNALGTGIPGANAALAPGVYELRITRTGGDDDRNSLGVDIRDAAGGHYNVYTIGLDDDTSGGAPAAADSGLVIGALSRADLTAPTAAITQQMVFYPYVNRGCALQASNYDADGNGSAELNDARGDPALPLAISGPTAHAETVVAVEATSGARLESLNYGIWTLTNDTGTQINTIDWRIADHRGWSDNPAARPRDPVSPLRTYLPNGYSGAVPPITNADAPQEPALLTTTRLVGGPNPPVGGSTTRLRINADVNNTTGAALSHLVITVPLAANAVYLAGSQHGYLDGTLIPACEQGASGDISGATFRRCTFATLPAGSVATLNIDVDFTPTALPPLQVVTGPPPAVAAGTLAVNLLLEFPAGTANAFTAAAHGFVAGQYVTITRNPAAAAGSAEAGYYGLARVTQVLSPTVFRYQVPPSVPTIAGGGGITITASSSASDPMCPYTANGPVCAQYTPAFGSPTWPRAEGLGPACQLLLNVGTGAAASTRASLRGLRVNGSSIEFATGSERHTAAFNLYSVDDGRAPLLLNAEPIRAARPSSDTPVVYRVATGGVAGSRILIEEIETTGWRRWMGPFRVDDRALRAAFERVERRLEAAGAALTRDGRRVPTALTREWARASCGDRRRRAAGRHSPVGRGQRGLRIEIAEPGWVEVPLHELHAQGLPAAASLDRIQLTNQGQAVEFRTVAGPNGEPHAIGFVAEPLSTDYTERNVYLLSWAQPAAPMAVSLTRSSEPPDPGTARAERNLVYLASSSPTGTRWFWDALYGNGAPWPNEWSAPAAFDLPALEPDLQRPVQVQVRVFAWSDHRHELAVRVNGVAVAGELSFEGRGYATLHGTIDGSVLRASENQLAVEYRGRGASDFGYLYLDSVDFEGVADWSRASGRVASIAAYDDALPSRLARAQYLILTHPVFRDQAERLVQLKRAEGLTAEVEEVDQAYDRYSAGVVEARAIQALIRELARGNRLRYLVLFGDDTIDTGDFLGTGATSQVPSPTVWDGEFGVVPSENPYADLDGDGSPELAVGRLPASTPEQAQALVDKIARQRDVLAAAAGRHLFLADDSSPGDFPFRAGADEAVRQLPAGTAARVADLAEGVGPAREALFAALAQGVAATHYFGHGGPEVLADEQLLAREDVARLAGGPETVLFAWTCEAQWYQYPFGDSLGEALVLLPRGGALASFGGAGITDPYQQRALSLEVYRRFLRQGLPLGEAIRRAKRDALARDPRSRPAVEGFNLLGDPALALEPSY